MEPKTSRFLDNYHARRAKDARRNIWVITFLFFLLLVGACSFLTISGHGATFRIGQEEQPVNIIEVSPGVWRAMLLNATATIDAAATLTVEQNDSLAAWQQTAGLFFFRNEGGAYTLLPIAEANAVTPVVSGNTITWPARWTFSEGTADYVLTITDWRILKTVRFSAPAQSILPSPTSAEFFPGAPEGELGFALGSDPFPGERAAGVTGEMDGVPIDLDDDQVVGVSMTMKWNGAFLHKFLPAYAGMHQGVQIYLGDLQMHFAAWGWADAKDEAEFDPSYTFQVEGIFTDSWVYETAPTTPNPTHALLYMQDGGSPYDYNVILDIDTVTLKATYGITGSSASISTEITGMDFKMTPSYYGAPTAYDVAVKRAEVAGSINNLTWNTRTTALESLYTYDVASWTDGATHTYNSSTMLASFRACIVAGTNWQVYLTPLGGDGSNAGYYASLNNATYGNHPVLSVTIEAAGEPTTTDIMAAIATLTTLVNERTTVIVNAIPNLTITELAIRERIASTTAFVSSASTSLTDSISEINVAANELAIRERISAATAFVSTASSSLTTAIAANNTAIVQNNVILHEVDNRTRLTQSDVLAAGGIVPTSGMLVTKTSLNVLGDPYRQLYITGPSLNPATPSIAIKLFQGLTTDIDSYPGGTILYASGSLAAFTSVVGSTVYIHSFYRDLPTVADFYRADVVVHDGTNPIFSQLTWSKSATPSLDTSDLLTQSNFNDWAAGNESVVFALSAGLVDLVTVYYADAEIDATTLAWATGKTGFYVPAGAVYGSNVEWDGRYGRNYGSILWNYLSTVSGRAQPLILSGTDVASVTPVQTQATAWGHAVSTK